MAGRTRTPAELKAAVEGSWGAWLSSTGQAHSRLFRVGAARSALRPLLPKPGDDTLLPGLCQARRLLASGPGPCRFSCQRWLWDIGQKHNGCFFGLWLCRNTLLVPLMFPCPSEEGSLGRGSRGQRGRTEHLWYVPECPELAESQSRDRAQPCLAWGPTLVPVCAARGPGWWGVEAREQAGRGALCGPASPLHRCADLASARGCFCCLWGAG